MGAASSAKAPIQVGWWESKALPPRRPLVAKYSCKHDCLKLHDLASRAAMMLKRRRGRVKGGDIYIGFALAYSPSDPDGAWPHQCVRNVLERLANKIIEDHIRNELYNSRGVVMRAIGAGGKQERDLGDQYKAMSEKLKAKWPRTSALLRSLCETYYGQAKREDIDSDLEDFRM